MKSKTREAAILCSVSAIFFLTPATLRSSLAPDGGSATRMQEGPVAFEGRRVGEVVERQSKLRYEIDLRLLEDGSARVEIFFRNAGKLPVFVASEGAWESLHLGRGWQINVGSAEGRYGDDIPKLTLLAPGKGLRVRKELRGEVKAEELDVVTISFATIREAATDLAARLLKLPTDAGWWDTSDLELTDLYYASVWDETCVFAVRPSRRSGD